MLLRPRQASFVDRCCTALDARGNTLGVAPTGSGKTVMISALVGLYAAVRGSRALILQHRDELTAQNRRTFHAVNPSCEQTGVIDATRKDFHLPITFAMVQTLTRNRQYMKPLDLLIVDEAHHVTAKSYENIIETAQEMNPDVMIAGFTATAQRGDKTPLRKVFDNVADQITLGEMVRSGLLVQPRTFVIDIGVREELEGVRQTLNDYDMDAVAKIMDRQVLNDQIVKHWKEKAGDRQTVVFCSTISHAEHVRDAFMDAGTSAVLVTGETPNAERRSILADFESGARQVIVNVAVLTEGWDCQPVSCVVLLRPSSYKSTMIQMAGRGLRRLDPEKYPGRSKTDCLILDFGTSVLTHGTLEMDAELEPNKHKGEAPEKTCPECGGIVPLSASECPLCGYVFPAEEDDGAGLGDLEPKEELGDFVMRELDIFDASPFKWEELWDGILLIANGFEAWGMTIWYGGEWHAICGAKGVGIRHIARGDKLICLSSADDWIRTHESAEAAHKSRRWLKLPPSDKQLQYLEVDRLRAMGMSRYRASCLLTWKFNERHIQTALMQMGREAA